MYACVYIYIYIYISRGACGPKPAKGLCWEAADSLLR